MQSQRVRRMIRTRKFDKLDGFLAKHGARGADVAGVPFKLLDTMLGSNQAEDWRGIERLARHLLGGQPRLFAAISQDLGAGEAVQLDSIVTDVSAHPMTRFEAMGWAVFLRNRAQALPTSEEDLQRPIVQFWDAVTPPEEIVLAQEAWRGVAEVFHCYSEAEAIDYVTDGFGKNAGRDFASLTHPALKSDVFRLYRMYLEGGLYVDADSLPGDDVQDFLKVSDGNVWISAMTQVPNCVAMNWFIAAPAQHNLIGAFLESALRNVASPEGRGIFWLAGPGALTQALYEMGDVEGLQMLSNHQLKAGLFRQIDAAYKKTEKNWRVFEHQKGVDNSAGLAFALEGLHGG